MKRIISNILLAVSGSEASMHAAKYAVIMARQIPCTLTAVYVVDTATLKQLTINRIFVQDESDEYERSLEENGKRYLGFVEDLAKAKGVKVRSELRKGAIHTELLKVSDEINADCVILGGWERDRDSRDIIQEAHREMLYKSKCSVLIVKEPDIDITYRSL